jgi:hypothetical protein
VTEDPNYLVEPLIKSEDFNLNPNPNSFNPFWPCEYVDEGERARGEVPHYLPGQNIWMAEYAATHNLPQEATLGGAEQMYPEYRERMKKLPVAVFVDPNAEPAAPAAPAGRGQGPAARPEGAVERQLVAAPAREAVSELTNSQRPTPTPTPKTRSRRMWCVLCAVGLMRAALLRSSDCTAQQPTSTAQQPTARAPQIRTAKQMPFPQKPDWAKLEVEALPVQGKVHLIAGAGGNIAVQIGDWRRAAGRFGLRADERQGYSRHSKAGSRQDAADDHQYNTGRRPHRGERRADQRGSPQSGGPGPRAAAERGGPDRPRRLLALMTKIGRAKIVVERWPPSTYSGKSKDCTRTTSRS